MKPARHTIQVELDQAPQGLWSLAGRDPATLLLMILPVPLLALVWVIFKLARLFTKTTTRSEASFDAQFTIEYTDEVSLREIFDDARMFMKMPAQFWGSGLQFVTLLGVTFVLVFGPTTIKVWLFASVLVFVIPVLTPVFLFRTRGPACPHIPRPPPSGLLA